MHLLPLLVVLVQQEADAEQVVLLDTTGEPTLDWTRYPYGPQANTPGWVEESFTNFQKGINWRSYVVCDVAYNNVNNWLWTPFIDRGVANRIYIEIKFTIRDCSLFPGTYDLFFQFVLMQGFPLQAMPYRVRKPSVYFITSSTRLRESPLRGTPKDTSS
jgi:hypothetical protein